MKLELLLSDEAILDIEEAFLWYAKIDLFLAENFESELYATLNNINLHPENFQIRYKYIKITYLKRFPYGIHYFVKDESFLIVIGVFHTSRNPKNWFQRIK